MLEIDLHITPISLISERVTGRERVRVPAERDRASVVNSLETVRVEAIPVPRAVPQEQSSEDCLSTELESFQP